MTIDDRRAVGHRIRALRERRGWDREALAERLGVHAGSIARWETGGSIPHSYTLERIAALAGGSAEWIRTGHGEPGGASPETEAEDLFVSLDAMARFVAGMAPPGEERLRKLDALEGLRRMLTARGALPGWWYTLRERVESGDL
ncbi:MAG TPA: helix-turn-helix transcriptional regulator [Longimicrobium sp.]|nr:helix-turn-helix transcriptional regulator [Longimicrobium sp.]